MLEDGVEQRPKVASPGSARSVVAMPCAAGGVDRSGNRASRRRRPSSTNRSKTSLSTSVGRASGRSILLMTTIGRKPALERLAQDEARLRQRPLGGVDQQQGSRRPCCRTRSTSPPKSAWPGVSMMLTLVPPSVQGDVLGQDGDAALALQVVGVEDQAVLTAGELVQLARRGTGRTGASSDRRGWSCRGQRGR